MLLPAARQQARVLGLNTEYFLKAYSSIKDTQKAKKITTRLLLIPACWLRFDHLDQAPTKST
jgi:hypothetical protein